MFKWLLILFKRLFKKATFLIILLLIPLVVLALNLAAKEKSGFISVALAQYDTNDKISSEIINSLLEDEKLIRFEYYKTPESAVESVRMGENNSAWIFPAEMAEKIGEFAVNSSANNYIVDVVERNQNVAMRLSHEKLSSVVYGYCSKGLYLNYVSENLKGLDVTDEELLENYNSFSNENRLFEFAYPNSEADANVGADVNYLIAPVRGLLSILVVLCGLAAALYYIQDEKNGTFSLLPLNKKPFAEISGQIVAVLSVAVVMMLSLMFIGLSVNFWRELSVTLLYVTAVALFCITLRQIIRNINVLASLIPLLMVIMIAVCPVFFEFKITRPLQLILPPTYYINAVHNNHYVFLLLIYILVLTVFNGAVYLYRIKKYEN